MAAKNYVTSRVYLIIYCLLNNCLESMFCAFFSGVFELWVLCIVYGSVNTFFLIKFSLKLDLMTLFTNLKIILSVSIYLFYLKSQTF